MRLIETNQDGQETLIAANSLLEELIQKSTFPQALLAPIYSKRGNTYHAFKYYQQAIADFDRALELDPNYAFAYRSRGWAYYWLKEYQRAFADFNHALELNPNYDRAYRLRGYTYLWLKDIKQARADYTRSWELDPSQIGNGWMIKWTDMCPNRPAPATPEWLETIAAIDPQLYTAYVCRGTAKFLSKHFEEALAELEQAIQLEPEEWSAYFWKGMACASIGRDKDAIAAIEKVLDLDLPPILLAPLCWFEQDRPKFFEKYAKPLLAHYEQACI